MVQWLEQGFHRDDAMVAFQNMKTQLILLRMRVCHAVRKDHVEAEV